MLMPYTECRINRKCSASYQHSNSESHRHFFDSTAYFFFLQKITFFHTAQARDKNHQSCTIRRAMMHSSYRILDFCKDISTLHRKEKNPSHFKKKEGEFTQRNSNFARIRKLNECFSRIEKKSSDLLDFEVV